MALRLVLLVTYRINATLQVSVSELTRMLVIIVYVAIVNILRTDLQKRV